MKAKNIIIIAVVNYMILVGISTIIELHVLSQKSKEIQSIMRTAGDMALTQSQVVDDFFASRGKETPKIKMASSDGNGFKETDFFGGLLGLDSSIPENTDKIFKDLYGNEDGNNDFQMLASRANAIRKPIKYWNATRTGFDWYYIPTLSMVGTDILPDTPATTSVMTGSGTYLEKGPLPETHPPTSTEILKAYELDSHIKTSGGEQYFNSPLNVGVTYLNEDLIRRLFMNNIDLLMRTKYKSNLKSEDGGNGILKGTTYSDKLKGDLTAQSPINNGSFTVLRGLKVASTPDVDTYEGVKPLIVYKIIDMYDNRNNNLLVSVFGANKTDINGTTYLTKADYLKATDSNSRNPATGLPYTSKPIVVAQVTFYVDVIVPYFSLIAREMRGSLGQGTTNFVELLPKTAEGANGTRRVSYTRYFAVAP